MVENIRDQEKKENAKKETDEKEAQEKEKETKSLSEEEKEVAKTAAKDKSSKEEAKKKVAKKVVKKETGYDAETLAQVGRNALDAKDTMEKPTEVGQTTEALNRVRGEGVKDMLGKIKDTRIAENVVKAGLGAMHASTTAGGLNEGAKTVLEKGEEVGGGAGMEDLLKQAVLYGNGMTLNEIKELKMTPDRLKEYVNQLKEAQLQPGRSKDKKSLPAGAFNKQGVDR